MPRHTRNVHPEPESSTGNTTSRLLEALERLLAHTVQQQHQQQPQEPQVNIGINMVMKQFRDFHLSEFKGSTNPLVAENLIMELEKVFNMTDVTETEKVICASFMLKEGASHWWDLIKRAYNIDEQPMMWASFKTLFFEKYFPRVKQEEKEAEFLSLKQGNLTLVEYERKFDELFRYAPHLVDTKERKARRFEKGLRPELYNAIALLQLPTYSEILQRVQLIAKDPTPEVVSHVGQGSFSTKRQEEGGFQQKRKFDGNSRTNGDRSEDKKFKVGNNRPDIPQCKTCGKYHSGQCWKVGDNRPDIPQCRHCGRNHFGQCWRRSELICYGCGKPGHIKRNCPEVIRTQQPTQGRVYTLVKEESEKDDATVNADTNT